MPVANENTERTYRLRPRMVTKATSQQDIYIACASPPSRVRARAAATVNIATGVQKVRNQSMDANAHRMRLHTDIQYTPKYNNYLPRLRNSDFVAG